MISLNSVVFLFLLPYVLATSLKFNSSNVIITPGPIIQTQYGPIQGREEFYDGPRSVYTYKGVRYASPPVGNLRFRQAIPPTPWTQVFQADQHGSWCPQFDMFSGEYVGNEDCLFLNIATPTDRNTHPVVVNFHGGGLQAGAAEIDPFRADYVNERGIVYVAPNYRLNILGFLNTGDNSSPGNYAIKDMITVLQWVRNNIGAFGGDVNNVAIMGVSGGAVAVHSLVVSRAAQGLFHKAISHSGSLFNTYAFTSNPQHSIQVLINTLQLTVTSPQNLVDQLRQLPAETLVRVTEPPNSKMPRLFEEFLFSPSIDPVTSQETRIFTDSIGNLISSGNINTVPYMMGFNSMESLYSITDLTNDPSLLNRFNQNPHLLVPVEWNLTPNSPQAQEVITAFRNLYFGGATTITSAHSWGWTQYVSDREFIFGCDKAVRLHWNRQNVYNFRFSFSGALSVAQITWGLSHINEAMHGDDAFYFFRLNPFPVPVPPNDPALTVQQRFIRLWTNFFRFSNPTAIFDDLVSVNWPRYTANAEFMDINQGLSVGNRVLSERMDIWFNFDRRFSTR